MDQRVSALQQRLQARREMYFTQKQTNGEAATPAATGAPTTPSYVGYKREPRKEKVKSKQSKLLTGFSSVLK